MFNERYTFFISLYFFITSWISKSQEGRDINPTFCTYSKFQKQIQNFIRFLSTCGSFCGVLLFSAILYFTEQWDSQVRRSLTTLILVQTCYHFAFTVFVSPILRQSNATRQLLCMDKKLTGTRQKKVLSRLQ